MQATQDKVVSIDYTLTDEQGAVLDTSEGRGPLAYLHGAKNIIPGLERELEGKAAGEAFEAVVSPAEAYGERNQDLVQAISRSQFPEGADPKVGDQFNAQTPSGARPVTVVKIEGDAVTIDANHPLAGKELNFKGKVVDVRDATDEERQHGHPHGPGGHSH